jgi:endonuclease YncB( thermonuclease family)
LTKGQAATVNVIGRDKYGRTLCRIEVKGQDVNRTTVADRLAWHYTRYSDDAGLAAAERAAGAAGLRLWGDPEPVAPWDWRANEKARKAAQREPTGR